MYGGSAAHTHDALTEISKNLQVSSYVHVSHKVPMWKIHTYPSTISLIIKNFFHQNSFVSLSKLFFLYFFSFVQFFVQLVRVTRSYNFFRSTFHNLIPFIVNVCKIHLFIYCKIHLFTTSFHFFQISQHFSSLKLIVSRKSIHKINTKIYLNIHIKFNEIL